MFLRKLVIFAGFALLPGLYAQEKSDSAKKQPNILLIISDDHAEQALGTEGKSMAPFPSLNKLGKEGMVFDQSFCCNSICGPSRAAILTGRHSHKNGFFTNSWNKLDQSQPNYAKMLQANGYQTGYIGKWHLVSDPAGFDYWRLLPNQGCYYNPIFYGPDHKNYTVPGYATDVITDMSLDWLKNRQKDQPFMLVVGHKAPHRAWAPAIRHLGKVDVSKLTPPATLYDDYKDRPEALAKNEMSIAKHMSWGSDLKVQTEKIPDSINKIVAQKGKLGELDRMTPEERSAWEKYYTHRTEDLIKGLQPGGKLTDPKALIEWKWRAYMEDYLSTLLAVDESVGKIMEYLDKENLSEDTLVIYCGDQSFYLGEHGWYDKRWVFEESLKMPLIMRWKGKIAPGVSSKALVQNIDYAPTFAAISGSDPASYGYQGRNLTPVLFDKKGKAPKDWRKEVYYAYYEWPGEHNVPRHDAIRTDDGITLAWLPRTKEWMLYDLKKDPQQMKNLIDDPAYATLLPALKKRYQASRKQYDVPDDLPGDGKKSLEVKATW